MRCQNCAALPQDPCDGRTFAYWVMPDGMRIGMCRRSLDLTLDLADDHEVDEPHDLIFVIGRGAESYSALARRLLMNTNA